MKKKPPNTHIKVKVLPLDMVKPQAREKFRKNYGLSSNDFMDIMWKYQGDEVWSKDYKIDREYIKKLVSKKAWFKFIRKYHQGIKTYTFIIENKPYVHKKTKSK